MFGATYNTGSEVKVKWSYQGTNLTDTNALTANLALGYFSDMGVKINLSVKSIYLSSAEQKVVIPATAPVADNYYVCLSPFYSNKPIGTTYCAPFVVKKPLTDALTKPQVPATESSAQAQTATTEFLGLNLKMIAPKHDDKFYVGDSIMVKVSYNSKYAVLGDDITFKVYQQVDGAFGMKAQKLIKTYGFTIDNKSKFFYINTQYIPEMTVGKYAIEMSYGADYLDIAWVDLIPKASSATAKPKLLNDVTDGTDVTGAEGVSLSNKSKLKAAITHLEQAIKLIKEALGE